MGPFIDNDAFFEKELSRGVRLRIVSGDKLMLSEVTLEPGAVVPLHSHPHEQAGRCLSGEFELEVGGEARRIRAGDTYLIPGGVPHSARGLEERCVTLDIFSPPREDYLPEPRHRGRG